MRSTLLNQNSNQNLFQYLKSKFENELEFTSLNLNLTINEKERLKFIKFVFKRLSKINEDNFLSDWKERWEKKCFHMNQEILILPDEKKAVFLCIDTSGRMIVQLDGEKRAFSSSEVKIRNAY